MKYILLADEGTETRDIINSSFKDEFKVVAPTSFNSLLKGPFPEGPFSKYFLAIVDHSFSGNKGFEVLQAIKNARPSLPILYTASEGTEGLCLSVFRLGARDYFKKPFEIEDLVRCIGLISQSGYGEKNKRDRKNILGESYSYKYLPHKIPQKIHPGIEAARKYMESNYDKTLSFPFIAQLASLDKHYFCKTFKKQTGKTYSEYINILRIGKAKGLLLERRKFSIIQIAISVGFNDHTYFDRVFTRIEGLSPSAYRKKHLS